MKNFFIFLLFTLSPMLIKGWSGNTHKLLSEYAYKNSSLVKNSLLLKLNLDQGFTFPLTVKIDTEIESKTVAGWIYNGAENEDEGNVLLLKDRSGRHFHNPLLAFNEAGLVRWVPLKQQLQSAILWAQDGIEQGKYAEGNMSWDKIKSYYLNGLISTNEEERQTNFGLMFKGLGHQMHLIQDLGNPEHSRNDNHPVITIENWAEEHNEDIIGPLCKNPIFPDVDLQTLVFDQSTQKNLIPISRLSDSDVYVPVNPIPLTGIQQGLAEYSKANFLTDDTIFSSDFPFPRSSGLDEQFPEVISEFALDEKALYASRTTEGEGVAIENFVRVGYLQKRLWKFGATDLFYRTYSLDNTCYEEYASKLIPRSVGYSAALLDYFFRGEIEISLPYSTNPALPQLDGIYGFTADGNLGFRYISLMAKNVTRDNEEMTNGFVSLIVSYRKGDGDPFVLNPPDVEPERFFIKSDYPNAIDIPRDDPIRLDFDLSSSPLPVDAVDVNLTLVFQGFLGAEFGTAVAIGFKDISEPTPIDFFNNTDKVCFNGNYVNYDHAALWDFVDVNPENGKIDCTNSAEIDITRKRIGQQSQGVYVYLSFNGKPATSTNYYYRTDDGWEILPGEAPKRLFVLTDADPVISHFNILVHAQSMENPAECFTYYDYNTVYSLYPYKNKLVWDNSDPNNCHYDHKYSLMGTFRGFLHWNLLYFENSTVPKDSTCSISSLGDSFTLSQIKEGTAFDYPHINCAFPKNK